MKMLSAVMLFFVKIPWHGWQNNEKMTVKRYI
jgi:hypothetical protein